MLSDSRMRASLQVAPLDLTKPRPEEAGDGSSSHDRTPKGESHSDASHLRSQMTPPFTPNGSQEDLSSGPESHMPPVFHNFLRAFYPFHPTLAMADSSVTLPLDEGDVILVHSIHTNGWADGTLMVSGARGWLPTNYCEAYEPEEMRNLLKALLNFWDLLRITSIDEGHMFRSQDFMKGLIGGERTQCLNRESTPIQRCDPLRRCRKSLLSELSSLVKTAKRLQELQRVALEFPDEVNDVVDQMILKAFKVVTKGVRFLDVMDDDKRAHSSSISLDALPPVIEETCVPPTPPADRGAFGDQTQAAADDRASAAATVGDAASLTSGETSTLARPVQSNRWSRRLSSLSAQAGATPRRYSQASMAQMNRPSANMAHRLSLAGPSPLSRPHHLVSERLSKSHDKFLSHLGSFIGRLHLQSQSQPELATAIKQSAISGGELLAIVDAVSTQSSSMIGALVSSREALLERIRDLVFAARDTLANAETEGADIIMPQDNNIMLMSATDCVRAAGECVALTKGVIERTGDFELESHGNALQLDLTVLDVPATRSRTSSVAERSEAASVSGSSHAGESTCSSSVRRPSVVTLDKPLPRVPESQPGEGSTPQTRSPKNSRPSSAAGEGVSSPASSATSVGRTLPPLPKLNTAPMPVDANQGTADGSSTHEHDPHASFDSMAGSSAGSSTTYLSRDSEVSVVSVSSTRATTPDHTLVPRSQPSMSELSTAGSSTHTEEADDVESKLLMKTYAHELVFNKEGQVTGGTLPALVERLTTHEATPDATFVSAFYLTFRLFCTPSQLTEALIDRFEYAEESPQTSSPVRLRVYNAFKGWLESHWRDQTDRDALKLIIPFAEARLNAVLPSAGSRLLELAHRVSGEGALVPRLVSSMGKTNTAIGQYVPADLPLPSPVISKSQQSTLQSFKTGNASPTILDFDPLELARQLTIKQMTIFCSILPEELLASQWMKKGGAGAPNVKAMSSLSTDLSNMVAEMILHQAELKKRAAVIKQWIKIGQHFLELHNYDGLIAIICTLNSSTITRLRKTWDAISQKRKDTLRQLQGIVEPSQNNKVLRTKLHDHVPPCLPFLGMYLTDLTFVDIGNPSTKHVSLGSEPVEDGVGGLTVVNFDKHTRTAKIIGELQRFQIPYRLTELPDMQDWLSAQFQQIREGDQKNVQATYYRKSLLLEPRETALKREAEAPAAAAAAAPTQAPSARTDLFGWMTRDRGGQGPTPSQV
ncbi:guanine nucleotide exchange factor [Trichoderma cornu-damae]|uniref:Guanine nucleotide exchange factor n=1 Tax=Trichoderma cornu-damae TaxID=654480 RepID=A0A9P8TUD1_9HYPO|nr:guanine nucleotide exchange factor [Trichoderma cornu-damae]